MAARTGKAMPYRLGIFQTHPIQYTAPWFRQLAVRPELEVTVYYCMLLDPRQQGTGFGVDFTWDIPLLDGYRYEVLENLSRHPGSSHFWGCITPRIRDIIRTGDFDAFLVSGWLVYSYLQALRACQHVGVPCICRGEANDLKPRPAWKRLLQRHLLSRYAAFISIGKLNREFHVRRGISPKRIIEGANCVECERIEMAAERLRPSRDTLRRKWGIPHEAYCFLFAGKLIRKKRPMDLLRALRHVMAARSAGATEPSPRLLMVGDGDLRPQCEAYVREHELPVVFTGFLNQSEMPQAYVTSDCLVLPSDWNETWGLVVNEAMVCGIPALVSDRVGCHPDLIIEGQTGHTFPLADWESLADLMHKLAGQRKASVAMGEAARRHARTYSIARLVNDTVRAVQLVADGSEAPSQPSGIMP